MPSTNFFPSAAEYIRSCNGAAVNRNCLKFSLGDVTPDSKGESEDFNIKPLSFSRNDQDNLALSFLKTVDNYPVKLEFNSSNFRRVDSLEEDFYESETYIFKVYGFDQLIIKQFGYEFTYYDFHVMRGIRNVSSGEIYWEHKMGWKENPGPLTSSDLAELDQQYDEKFVFFAFTPPSK